MPDGIVCASDYIAHFIQRYLEEKGIDPEGRIVLTGFDNNSEYLNVADRITTVDVKPKTIGSRLAAKILFVIEHPKAAPEVSYVSSEVLYRGVLASDPKASNPDESILYDTTDTSSNVFFEPRHHQYGYSVRETIP